MSTSLLINLCIGSLLSAMLYIILKYFQRFKIYNLHGLTFNYITAASFAFFSEYKLNINQLSANTQLLPFAFGIGLLFIIVFYIAALTAQKSGIAITSIAGKMSMVIPIVAGILIYNDQLTILRITGIALALIAVYLSSASKSTTFPEESGPKNSLYPVLLFIGSGLVDTSIKLSQHYFINPENENIFFCFLFGSAGFFGIIATTYLLVKKNKKIELKSIIGGIILGITNYYSLVFLVKCLSSPGAESALIFSMANMLVVIFSSLAAFLIFFEKPTTSRLTGIGLALLAIFILTY